MAVGCTHEACHKSDIAMTETKSTRESVRGMLLISVKDAMYNFEWEPAISRPPWDIYSHGGVLFSVRSTKPSEHFATIIFSVGSDTPVVSHKTWDWSALKAIAFFEGVARCQPESSSPDLGCRAVPQSFWNECFLSQEMRIGIKHNRSQKWNLWILLCEKFSICSKSRFQPLNPFLIHRTELGFGDVCQNCIGALCQTIAHIDIESPIDSDYKSRSPWDLIHIPNFDHDSSSATVNIAAEDVSKFAVWGSKLAEESVLIMASLVCPYNWNRPLGRCWHDKASQKAVGWARWLFGAMLFWLHRSLENWYVPELGAFHGWLLNFFMSSETASSMKKRNSLKQSIIFALVHGGWCLLRGDAALSLRI